MILSFLKVTALAIVLALPAAYAVPPAVTSEVRYFANLNIADSVVNLTNDGSDPAGDICANFYVFDVDEQLVSCCACPLTPNNLKTVSLQRDVLSNLLTPGVPTALTVEIVASTGPICNPATVTAAQADNAIRAWATTIHAQPVGYGVTETEFSPAFLGPDELQKLTSFCSFIQADGSFYGLCKSCYPGAQGAARQ